MIKIYGMASCKDCAYVSRQTEGDPRFKKIDIGCSTAALKAFLTLRDTHPLFLEVKARGGIGIPCFVLEDGTVTLTPEDAGLVSRPEEEESSACCCSPEGC